MKYICIVKYSIKNSLTSLSDLLILLARPSILLLVQYTIFKAVYYSGHDLAGYSFKDIISYIFITSFVYSFVDNSVIPYMIENFCLNGKFAVQFVFPVHFFLFLFFKGLGENILKSAPFLILTFILSISGIVTINKSNILVFIPALTGAFLINFSMFFMISTLVFKLKKISGVNEIFRFLFNVISGRLFPLSFLPGIFRTLLLYTPFSISVYLPVRILMGKAFKPGEIIALILYAMLFVYFGVITFNKSVRYYEGYGG